MAELKGLDGLNKEVGEVLAPYCQEMIALHKDNLLSIVLYGSACGPDFVHKHSNVNLMVVLSEVSLAALKASLKIIAKGRRKGIVAPLFFNEDHIRRSADVFPIEFLDIQENHVVLYGEDPFAELEIDSRNVRLQCEHELKGKLIRLRQGYLERGLLKKDVVGLMVESLTSFTPIFRNMLRLKQQPLPKARREVIESTARVFGFSADPFLRILQLKHGMKVPDLPTLEALFAEYLKQLDRLAVEIDELRPGQ